MKNIWLNILAFAAFLAIEITAVSFMSTYSAHSAAMALLGVLALVIGGLYTAMLGRDVVSIKRCSHFPLLFFIHFCFFSMVSGSNRLPVTAPQCAVSPHEKISSRNRREEIFFNFCTCRAGAFTTAPCCGTLRSELHTAQSSPLRAVGGMWVQNPASRSL